MTSPRERFHTLAPAGAPGSVRVQHDRFKGTQVAVLDGMTVTASADLGAGSLSLTGTAVSNGGSLQFLTAGEEWHFLKCSGAAGLVDGEKLSFTMYNHDGSVGSGYVTESMDTRISRDDLLAIAAAKESVEFRLCFYEITLTERQRRVIAEWARTALETSLLPDG